MECYLISGGASRWEKAGLISQTLKKHNAKKLLVVARHHHRDGHDYRARLIAADSELENFEITYFDTYEYRTNYQLVDFDAIYVTGGLTQILDINLWYSHLAEDLQDSAKRPPLYICASAGAQMLTKKLHTEMEDDAVHLSRFIKTGLGIFPHILLEVHYDEESPEMQAFRRHRLIETLNDPDNTDLEFAYAMNGDAVIHIPCDDFAKRRVLHGQCFVIRRDGSEVMEEGNEIQPA